MATGRGSTVPEGIAPPPDTRDVPVFPPKCGGGALEWLVRLPLPPPAQGAPAVPASKKRELEEVVAVLVQRDDEFRPLIESVRAHVGDEPVWTLSELKEFLDYNDWD